MNHVNLEMDSLNGGFSFMVGGHFYGAGSNKSGYPAATLLANLDSINNSNIDFLVSLGDLFSNIDSDLRTYKTGFFSKLKMPIFNAVGNHDLFNEELYEKEYGQTFFSFEIGENLFLVLDTEMNGGNIEDEQLKLFNLFESKVKNIFIFSHNAVWMQQFPEIEELFPGLSKPLVSTFNKNIKPILEASSANIYWLSGSMGAYANESFFYKNEKNVHYILSAIRDKKSDGLLKVYVKDDNSVAFETMSLTEKKTINLEKMDIDYWKGLKGNIEFGWPVIKFQIWRTVSHNFFWIGGFSFLATYFLSRAIIRGIR